MQPMFKNKKLFTSIGLSLLITALFAIGALLKPEVARIDLYLGTIWVFTLSTIISFSLSHHFAKTDYKSRDNHEH